ncbi:MAG: ParB/RepB/Spo0J family partition protein [Polyangiaceae bacterium]|nr:ParB/RepB/Spo0J family partition protein [Polyangiaceae bacterium]
MSAPDPKRRALGRGLDALLPAPAPAPTYGDRNVFSCPLEKIVPQGGQPRQHFDTAKLDELAQSIREHGLIEPLVVRRVAGSDQLELVAGERRWRALQRAGLREALVVVKDVSANDAFELALIENVQREDLNPIELAEAYDRLVRDHGYTHEALATRVGKDRTTIANALRLLKLPPRVRARVIGGELTEGHARALLGATDGPAIEQLADRVVRGRLSVRATEALVRQRTQGGGSSNGSAPASEAGGGKSASVRDLEQRLTRALGTKVEVRDRGNKGEVVIPYADLDALDRVLAKLM